MDHSEWRTLIDALRIIAPGLTALAIYQLRQLAGDKRKIEKDIERLKAWQENHERLDNLRFEHAQNQLNDLKEEAHESARK